MVTVTSRMETCSFCGSNWLLLSPLWLKIGDMVYDSTYIPICKKGSVPCLGIEQSSVSCLGVGEICSFSR
ncbi:hypothetical protein SUGI_0113880 [Cryptomeria japonica]|nr:hypothetical protein SUGI_0113880 [Cryptomeria japonica]